MENANEQKSKGTVLLVLAIVFSVIFVPVLLALVPLGGVAITASTMFSQESIEEIVDDAGISEEIYDTLMEEVENANSGFLKPEVIQEIAEDSIREKDIDKIIDTFIDCVYNNKSKKIDLSNVEERLQENLTRIANESFDDLYSAWMYDTPSKYFIDDYKYTFFEELESSLLEDYSNYGAKDLDELERKYDIRYGSGSFDRMVSNRIMLEQQSYEERSNNIVMDSVTKGIEEAETAIEEIVDGISGDSSARTGIDVARTIGDNRILFNVIVYLSIYVIVLILLLLYRFRTAGFVVSSIPLLIGGIGCKVLDLLKRMILTWLDRGLVSDIAGNEQYEAVISSVIRGILEVVFGGLSKYGTVMLLSGIALIVAAIVCGVLRKRFGREKVVCEEITQ